MDINHQEINEKIHNRFKYFWPQWKTNYPHEDNLKIGLVEYFLDNNIVSYPEFSIPGGRCDLLGIDKRNNSLYLCEFKHSYYKNINAVIADINRLLSLEISSIIKDRTNLIVNQKNIIFICGMMSEMHFIYESVIDRNKHDNALAYLKECKVPNAEEKLTELHKLLLSDKSNISIFQNVLDSHNYWNVIWSI